MVGSSLGFTPSNRSDARTSVPLEIQADTLRASKGAAFTVDSLKAMVNEELSFESVETYVPTKFRVASAAACASKADNTASVT